ncbi:hypothetical protein [Wolbachia endosymbiont (group B) of Eucosma cana]|uniref:hypothetical protein n=1 Tax=Wolbachia endosymbiont (group B) of Eucosma cana TaxID=2954012 RepID=UPI0022274419|nr:hypothetical protein [Wolbachia endosymbiont (group B) of Eucosma cana]
MLTFVLDGVRYTYNWLIKKSRSTTLDFIALFNKKYADSKRIGYIIEDHLGIELKTEQMEQLEKELKIEPKVDFLKMFEVFQQKQEQELRSIKNLENVIRVRLDDQIYCAFGQAREINGITKGNTDLVLLLWLMYVHVPIGEHEKLLEDLVKNHSGNRAEMIEKLYSLQEEGKLSITSRKSLDWIIKISPLIEQYISNEKFSVMGMVSSGNIHGLEKRLTEDMERRVKELTGIDILYIVLKAA